MDNKPRLPSITTQFAEFFPDRKANTAPAISPGGLYGQSPVLKRKRSDPIESAREAPPRPAKQPYSGSSSGWSAPSRLFRSEADAMYASSRDYHYPTDSTREFRSSASAYPKFSYSPPRLNKPAREHEARPEDEKVPVSASTATTSGISEKSTRFSYPEEPRPPQSRTLPPIAGLDSAPQKTKDEFHRDHWKRDRSLLPPVIEPRTQYQPFDGRTSSETDYRRDQPTTKRRRSSSFDRPTEQVKTPRRQSHEYPCSAERQRYRPFLDSTSPTNMLPQSGSVHHIQPLTAQPPTWDHGTSSQLTSPTETSPASATRPTDSTRYSWDAPSLYDNMRSIRKRRGNLPKESTATLNDWYNQHASYPYPKEAEKQELQARTGLAMSQISNWFINARRRRRPSATSRTAEGLPRSLAFDFPQRKD